MFLESGVGATSQSSLNRYLSPLHGLKKKIYYPTLVSNRNLTKEGKETVYLIITKVLSDLKLTWYNYYRL